MWGKATASALAALSLAACSTSPGAAPVVSAPPDRTVTQTVAVTAPRCIRHQETKPQVGPVAAALIAAVGGALIDKTVDGIAAAVRKAGEGDTVTVDDKTSTFLHTPLVEAKGFGVNPNLGCLIVVHGPMSSAERPASPRFSEWAFSDDGERAYVVESLAKAGIPLAGDPDFYMEAVLEKDPAGVIRYRPAYLAYLKPIKSSWGDDTRSVVLTLALGTPSADGAKAFATGVMTLKDLQLPFQSNNSSFLANASTAWMPLASPDAVSEAALDKAVARLKSASETEAAVERRLTESQLLARRTEQWRKQQAEEKARPRIEAENARLAGERKPPLGKADEDRILADEQKKLENIPLPPDLGDKAKKWLAVETERTRLTGISKGKTQQLASRQAEQKAKIATFEDSKSGASRAELGREQLAEIAAIEDAENKIKKLDEEAAEEEIAKLVGDPSKLDGYLAKFRTQPNRNATPIVIGVTLTETRTPNKVLLFIADVMDGAKGGVKQTLASRLPKSDAERAKEEETATQASEGLAEAALKAKQAYDLAKVELDSLPATATPAERKAAENKVELARFQARVAYRRAGQTADF